MLYTHKKNGCGCGKFMELYFDRLGFSKVSPYYEQESRTEVLLKR